jgi:hypothetical protein
MLQPPSISRAKFEEEKVEMQKKVLGVWGQTVGERLRVLASGIHLVLTELLKLFIMFAGCA